VSVNQIYPPYIIERSSRGSAPTTSSAAPDGPHRVPRTPINDEAPTSSSAQLLFLDADNPEKDSYLYINSPGGIISSGMAIYDTCSSCARR